MNTQNPPLSDAALSTLATQFVLAMMASASTQKIRPMDWWERAKSALVTSAAASENRRDLVTRFAKRVQIQTLTAASVDRLNCLSSLDDPAVFQRFVRVVSREAVFIVAMAQEKRADEREEKAAKTAQTSDLLDKIEALTIDRDAWKNRAHEEAENTRVLAAKLLEVKQ